MYPIILSKWRNLAEDSYLSFKFYGRNRPLIPALVPLALAPAFLLFSQLQSVSWSCQLISPFTTHVSFCLGSLGIKMRKCYSVINFLDRCHSPWPTLSKIPPLGSCFRFLMTCLLAAWHFHRNSGLVWSFNSSLIVSYGSVVLLSYALTG